MKKIIVIFNICIFSLLNSAWTYTEEENLCLQNQRSDGSWGPMYNVDGVVIDGLSFKFWLRQQGHYIYDDLEDDEDYLVIYWNNGGWIYFSNTPTPYFTEDFDQDNEYWRFKESLGFSCDED